jgi:glycosyltransferase involved in cell wall biosynthesis
MKNPLVSVLIPTFNRAYCVGNAIESALAQTYENIEIIVIDDGSTDETENIVARKFSSDKRVRYVRKTNGGVSSARNCGIKTAKGDYIAFLDSDDTWKTWKIDLQLKCLEIFQEAEMVWTDMEAVRDEQKVIVHGKYLRKMYSAYSWFTLRDIFEKKAQLTENCICKCASSSNEIAIYCGNVFSAMIVGNLVHTSTVLISKKRLSRVGLFKEDFRTGEDYEFHLRTCKEGPVCFADISSTTYRIENTDQLTSPEYRLEMATNFLKTILPFITSERNSITLSDKMINRVLADAYGWIGDIYCDLGQQNLAKKHLIKSLKYNVWQPRLFLSLLRISL